MPAFKVYLAGPITGRNHRGCTEWREDARIWLADEGITAYSPMRGKQFLAKMSQITAQPEDYPDTSAIEAALTSRVGIIGRDFNDVVTSDAVLVNLLGASEVSVSTVLEMGWAWQAGVPIVVVVEPDGRHPHAHCMLDALPVFTVHTLEDGVALTKLLLLP